MNKKFSKYEIELLNECSDNKDRYAININPKTKKVTLINIKSNAIMWNFGESNVLTEKLIDFIDTIVTYQNI